jgi:hypothetical protein
MRKSVFLAALLFMGGSAMAGDEATVLTGSKLRGAISGKTIYLMTPLGEIPIQYQSNGTMRGSSSATLATFAGESVTSDTGRWWVMREQLCQQWKNWADSRSHCYKLRTAGSSVQWRRNDGQSGTARIASN